MKKKEIFLIAILIFPFAIIALRFCVYNILVRVMLTPPTIIEADNVNQLLENKDKFHIIGARCLQGPSLPKDAKNIFACSDNHRDPGYYLAFDSDSLKNPAFIKRLVGVPIGEFSDKFTSVSASRIKHFFEGPYDLIKKRPIAHPRWKPSEIRNGKFFNKNNRYIAIDIDKSRIFILLQTS